MKPYYEHAGITIYHGDCREVLPYVVADVLVTDPPYGVFFSGSATRHSDADGETYTFGEDSPAYLESEILPRVREALGVIPRAAITPGIANSRLYPKPDGEGVFWYPSGANRGPWGFVMHQPIFYYGKCPYLASGRGSRPTSRESVEASEQNGHPCPKPIGQWQWLVNRVANPDDVVLDIFMGSGTTLRAAKNLMLKAVGIEIEERYCEIAAKRLAQEVLPLELSS